MSDNIVPAKKVIKLKHLLFGLIILISGILIGFVGGAYTVGKHFDSFRPSPKKISEKIAGHIVDDFPSLHEDKAEVQNLISNEFSKFGLLSEEVSYRILQMQHDIAVDIAEIIPDKSDKERWMATFPEYFPGHKRRLHRARKYEERHKCNRDDNCMLEDWDRPPPPRANADD